MSFSLNIYYRTELNSWFLIFSQMLEEKNNNNVNKESSKKRAKQHSPNFNNYLVSFLVLCIACVIFLALNSTGVLNNLFPATRLETFQQALSTNPNEMAEALNSWKTANSIYEFQAKDIDGNTVDFSKYKLNLKSNNKTLSIQFKFFFFKEIVLF